MSNKIKYKILFKSLIVIFIVVSFGVFLFANQAQAACEGIKLQTPIPGIGKCVSGFPEYVQAIYRLFIGVIGILAVIMIMAGEIGRAHV